MPDRLIRESWCASEKIDRLTPFEETVLARLIVNCDDFGRMDGRANVLCSRLFVTRRDVGAEQMRAAIAALEREGLVSRYAVAGKEYLQMRGWGEHQRIRTQRSKYPAPPDAAEASRGISLAYHAAEALPDNAGNAQAMLPGGGAAHVSPMQTADAGQAAGAAMPPNAVTVQQTFVPAAGNAGTEAAAHALPGGGTARVAEMLPDNAGNAQVALPGGGAGGRTASFDAQPRDGAAEGVRGPFDEQPRAGAIVFPEGRPRGGVTMFPGEQVRAGAESHPYYTAGSAPIPPGVATPAVASAQSIGGAGQGAQADFALPQPAADRGNMQQPAADCGNMHQPAADRSSMQQPAAECSSMHQPAADCGNLQQIAADRCNLRLESESNPNPNRNPNRSRESKPIGSPAAPAGAAEGARAREAFSEFWKKYPKKAGRAEALEAYLREKAYLQQKTLLAALAEQCKNENWRKERGRFVPRAANWLADHRWEETPLPPAADEGGTGPPSRREQELLRMVNDPIEALLRAEQEEI